MAKISDEALISEVQKHPLLYNVKLRDYKNRQKRRATWEVVADALLVTGDNRIEICVTKWKSIRDRYLREKKKINTFLKSGVAASTVTTWYLYPLLDFLRPHIQPRSTISNLKNEDHNEALPTNRVPDFTERSACVHSPQVSLHVNSDCMPEDMNDTTLSHSLVNPCQTYNDFPTPVSINNGVSVVGSKSSIDTSPSNIQKSTGKSPRKDPFLDGVERIMNLVENSKQDADKLFLLSLLPHIKQVPQHKRLELQHALLSTIKKFRDELEETSASTLSG